MGQKSVVLDIPDDLLSRLRQIAEASDRSLENVLLESLDVLFSQPSDDAEIALKLLPNYSDTQLWAVVQLNLSTSQSRRLQDLGDKNKRGELEINEQAELQSLLDLVDRNMLLRSEALLLLKQRGYDVSGYFE